MSEQPSLEEVVRSHRSAVLRYAHRVCPSSADAEDATQSTLAKFVALQKPLRRRDNPRPWLYTVTRNYCLRLLRRASRMMGPVPETADPHAVDPSDRELVSRLLTALAELEPAQREVLIRRDVLGESAAEAARGLGISVGALKSRLHRARRALLLQVG